MYCIVLQPYLPLWCKIFFKNESIYIIAIFIRIIMLCFSWLICPFPEDKLNNKWKLLIYRGVRTHLQPSIIVGILSSSLRRSRLFLIFRLIDTNVFVKRNYFFLLIRFRVKINRSKHVDVIIFSWKEISQIMTDWLEESLFLSQGFSFFFYDFWNG